MKIKKVLFICLLIISTSVSQTRFSVGSNIGYSNFSSSSPTVDGFVVKIYLQTDQPLFEEVYPRLSVSLLKDIKSILPADKTPYYPQMILVSFSGVTAQYFDSRIYMEEAFGIKLLNDKSFVDRNSWEYGISLSFLSGLDMRNFNLQGWQTGIGLEYGLTFSGALPSYLNFYLQFQYNF